MDNNQAHILVVDDEPDNRNIIQEFLKDYGYRFSMAEDGAIAWNLLQQDEDQFDVVLLDIMMPNMNGLELLKLIKAHEKLREIPVIIQTARGNTTDIAKGIKAGAFYYLTKPFEEGILHSIVKTAVDDHQRLKALQAKIDLSALTFDMMKSGIFQFNTLQKGQAIVHFLAQACPDPGQVVLGLSELLINAVEHGNLGISYEQKSKLLESDTWHEEVERRLSMVEYRDRYVEVRFNRDDRQINFTVTDQGDGFDWKPYMKMAPERGKDRHGRGIAMAGMVSFDSIEFKGKGNKVVATLKL